MVEPSTPLLVWGCDPGRQLEQGWVQALLGPLPALAAWGDAEQLPLARPGLVVLVESGLLRLERSPDPARLQLLLHQRRQRLQRLAGLAAPLGLLHLSDEEGRDGDSLYPLLPPHTVVWRNFPYPRHAHCRNFPIGPRAEFLEADCQAQAGPPASQRPFPWAFMGTLWASGSRTLAASLFLRALPQGVFYGGQAFGRGLPLPLYRQHLLSSAFALCPEGDRHLDTFRLYESLQAGCIPVLVDQRAMALALLGDRLPWPVFASWSEALAWVQALLRQPQRLDATQRATAAWWRWRRQALAVAMRHTLDLPLA